MDKKYKIRLLIVGAGMASKLLLKEIKKNSSLNYEVIGFAEDFKKIGTKIDGIKVLGKIKDIPKIVKKQKIGEIIIAIPSLKKERLQQFIEICEKTNVRTQILPPAYEGLYSLKTGRPWIKELRPINLEDLLRRDVVKVDLKELEKTLSNKTILVTGGGGSIGSELCRQIIELNPRELIIVDNCEFNLYEIDRALKEERNEKSKIKTVIGDVKDANFVDALFKKNNIDIVFHAAAYKHVPLMEFNIKELVKNNIFGTYNVAYASEKYGIKKFVLVSTDKAVNPTSVMGVSKRIGEMLLGIFKKQTEFIIVRFGNVLASKGSILPLFEEQIKKGGPLTITHPEIKRYFMTIPEASQLILQAAAIGKDKDILILDMGKQYKIVDIANELIKLHGLIPGKEIKIVYLGLRPGEKLYEELWNKEENILKTKHRRIFLSRLKCINKKDIISFLDELKILVKTSDEKEIKTKFKKIIPAYKESSGNLQKNELPLESKRILITGGAGFIGSHLKKRLDIEGLDYDEFSYENGDLSDKKAIDKFPKYDIIFHLASGLPQRGFKEFEKDVVIMKNLLNYCKKNSSRLIFTSSCAVYGKVKINPVGEETKIDPRNEYGKSKAEAEKLFLQSGVKGVILRLFNVYGFGQYEKFIIPLLLKSCKKNEVLLTRGAKRDFVNIIDVVEALLKAAKIELENTEVFNIGSGEEHSLDEILDIILGESEIKLNRVYRDPPEGEEVSSILPI